MNLPLRRTNLDRKTLFSFSCRQCLKCCNSKKIQVNPYEIARLASSLAISTTDFINTYTDSGGTVLSWDENDNCIFLDSQGCSVHQHRPLVCRLYPLGRRILASGQELFSEIEPDAGCTGLYAEDQCIDDYLDAQGAVLYIEAASSYLDLYWRLLAKVQHAHVEPKKRKAIIKAFQEFSCGVGEQCRQWMDMDAIVSEYCKTKQTSPPQNMYMKMLLHIQALNAWIQPMPGDDHEEELRQRQVITEPFR